MSANNLAEDNPLFCDLLLFFATGTEKEQLKQAAKEMQLPFDRMSHKGSRYYRLGKVGDYRVNAVKTEMGPLSYQGSASQGIVFKAATGHPQSFN